jgi:hypothetical protein
MNPWLEPYWPDIHASLLVYASDQLNQELPPGLRARIDEQSPVDLGKKKIRHLEIVVSRSHVITALEVLSPSNKEGSEPMAWKQKRTDCLRSGINFVEIDLLRTGAWTLPDCCLLAPAPPGRVCYYACVTRVPWHGKHEFYVLPLRRSLPHIPIPLRRTDRDVALDLQALVDQCYQRGRYGSEIHYSRPTQPRLPEEEAAWAQQILSTGTPGWSSGG